MGSVSHRPASELMQSLRTVLQNLERNFSSLEDQPMFAELRRLILLHIADLESIGGAVEKAKAEEAVHQDAVRLPFTEDDPEAA
jgi:hypothetical protein